MSWSWINSHTALLALVITAIAAALTLTNTLLNRRYRRQDAYLRMQDMLTTPEMQRGRRLVYEIGRSGNVPPADSEDNETVNRALAGFNNLAMYVRRGAIGKSWALDGWHHQLRDVESGATTFIEHRMKNHSWRVWTDLQGLIADAKTYKSRRPCCTTASEVAAPSPSGVAELAGHDLPEG